MGAVPEEMVARLRMKEQADVAKCKQLQEHRALPYSELVSPFAFRVRLLKWRPYKLASFPFLSSSGHSTRRVLVEVATALHCTRTSGRLSGLHMLDNSAVSPVG